MEQTPPIKRKGRPDKIEPLKNDLSKIWTAHPQWSDKEVRNELKTVIIGQVKKEHTDWNESQIDCEVEARWPGIYSIGEHRRKNFAPKKKEIEASRIDGPWNLGLMSKPEYNIPPEAVPFILEVQDWLEKMPGWRDNRPPPQKPLTIRQALWIGRIYRTVDKGALAGKIAWPEWLFIWAEIYANLDAISALSDTDPDTTFLDKKLHENIIPIFWIEDEETGVKHWLDGSIVDTSFFDKENRVEKAEQIVKDGETK